MINVNTKVQNDTDIIKGVLVEQYGDSFESIVIVNPDEIPDVTKKGLALAVSEYQLALFVISPIDRKIIDEMSSIIESITGVGSVKIIQVQIKKAGKLKLNIFSSKLRHSGKQIYGDFDVFSKIPDYPTGLMPHSEADKAILHNLVLLLEYSPKDFDNENYKSVMLNIVKTVFNCVTALVVSRGEYHHNFEHQLENFNNIAQNEFGFSPYRLHNEKFEEIIDTCLKMRTGQDCEISNHVLEFWNDCRIFCLDFVKVITKLKFDSDEWVSFPKRYCGRISFQLMKIIKYFSSFNSEYSSQAYLAMSAVLLLASWITPTLCDEKILKESIVWLKKSGCKDDLQPDWETIRISIVKSWKNLF